MQAPGFDKKEDSMVKIDVISAPLKKYVVSIVSRSAMLNVLNDLACTQK